MSTSPEHRGAVAGGHPETVGAAAAILRSGGNAFDAAVGAGFAAAVAEPGLTSLGGGGFLLARTAEGGERLFDFFVDTPGRGRTGALEPHLEPIVIRFRGADQVFHVGYGSVAVPGCLAGYLHVHAELGRLPLADVTAPARRLAEEGIVLNHQQDHLLELLEPINELTEDGRRLFAPNGTRLHEGDRYRSPEYGEFLDAVTAGEAGFADTDIGSELERLMDDNDGLVTMADLEAYEVIEREPLAFEFGGARIITNPPPSFGGAIVRLGLTELDRLEQGAEGDWSDAEAYDRLVRALEHMYTTHRSRTAPPQSKQGTTHLSVTDAEGNVAAMTTSNGSNSGIFVPHTGVHLNNIMGEDDLRPEGLHAVPPGRRVGSMMAPTIAFLPDGEIVALGSGGSERIRSALMQVLCNIVGRNDDLQEAIDAPRVHWDGTALQVEPGVPDDAVEQVARRLPVNRWQERNLYFGGCHAASTLGRTGGDPRRGGSVAVL